MNRAFILTAEIQARLNTASMTNVVGQIRRGLNIPSLGGGAVGGGGAGRGIGGGSVIALSTGHRRAADSTRQWSRATRQLNNDFHQQARYMSTSIRDIATLTGGVLTLRSAVMLLGTGLRSAVEFEAQLGGMAQVAHRSLAGLKDLGGVISNLAVQYGVSAKILGQNALELLQAGKSIAQVKEALPTLALLGTNAQVGATGLQNAARAMIVWQNVFGVTMQETRQMFEKTIKVSKMQYINTAQLIEGTTILSQLMKGLNVTFVEQIALVAALRTQTGRSVNEISRALRTMLTRVVARPTTMKFFEERGVKLFEKGKLRNVVQIFIDIKKLEDQLGKTSREGIKLQTIMGGIRRVQYAPALLEAMPEVLRIIQAVSGEVDELDRDFEIWSETTKFAADQVGQTFNRVFRDIMMDSPFEGLANQVLGFSTALLQLINSLRDIAPILLAIGGGFLGKRLLGGGTGGALIPGHRVPASMRGGAAGGFWESGLGPAAAVFAVSRQGVKTPRTGPGYPTPRRGFARLNLQRKALMAQYGTMMGIGGLMAAPMIRQAAPESPLAAGAATGLTTGIITRMMGGAKAGPLGAVVGLVMGLDEYTKQVFLQAERVQQVPLAEALQKLMVNMEAVADQSIGIQVKTLTTQLEQAVRIQQKFRRGAEEGQPGVYHKVFSYIKGLTAHAIQPWEWIGDPKKAGNLLDEIWEKNIGTANFERVVGDQATTMVGQFGPAIERMLETMMKTTSPEKFEQQVGKWGKFLEMLGGYQKEYADKFKDYIERNKRLWEEEIQKRQQLLDHIMIVGGVGQAVGRLRGSTAISKGMRQGPLRDLRRPETLLSQFRGLQAPIHTQPFQAAAGMMGAQGLLNQQDLRLVGAASDAAKKMKTIFTDMEQWVDPKLFKEQIVDAFDLAGVDKGITAFIQRQFSAGKLDFDKIAKTYAEEGVDGVVALFLKMFELLESGIRDKARVDLELRREKLQRFQTGYGMIGVTRQAQLQATMAGIGVMRQRRQFGQLPTLPGVGDVAIRGAAGGTVQELEQDLLNLHQMFEKTGDPRYAAVMGDVVNKLRLLADASGRTADTMRRLQEVEKSRTAKLSVLGEFFGADLEGRRQIAMETQAAQMAVRRGNLLAMPMEAQAMALKGLSRFSGVANFMGTGMTGGQLIEKLLTQAGQGWLLPEDIERANLQREVLAVMKDAASAQIVLANYQARLQQTFFQQLNMQHGEFLNKLAQTLGVKTQQMAPLGPMAMPGLPRALQRRMMQQQRRGVGGGALPGFLGGAAMPGMGQEGVVRNIHGQLVITREEILTRRRAQEAARRGAVIQERRARKMRGEGATDEQIRAWYEGSQRWIEQKKRRAMGFEEDIFNVKKGADQFGEAAQQVNEGVVQFGDHVVEFNQGINNFGEVAAKFGEVAAAFREAIPDTVAINAQHVVDVVIHGAEMFDEMKGSIADLVKSRVQEEISKWSERLSDLGPDMSLPYVSPSPKLQKLSDDLSRPRLLYYKGGF